MAERINTDQASSEALLIRAQALALSHQAIEWFAEETAGSAGGTGRIAALWEAIQRIEGERDFFALDAEDFAASRREIDDAWAQLELDTEPARLMGARKRVRAVLWCLRAMQMAWLRDLNRDTNVSSHDYLLLARRELKDRADENFLS